MGIGIIECVFGGKVLKFGFKMFSFLIYSNFKKFWYKKTKKTVCSCKFKQSLQSMR